MLERYEGKLSRTVLRRGRASNRSFLFGTYGHGIYDSEAETAFKDKTLATPHHSIVGKKIIVFSTKSKKLRRSIHGYIGFIQAECRKDGS